MENLLQHILLIFIPMILANSFHMVFVKWDILSSFKIPISVKLFGQNKTWRGFILLPLLSAFFALLGSLLAGPFLGNHLNVILFGIGMGIVYLLAELPNSYVKRKLHIPNGGHSEKYKVLQIIIDRADSLVGIFLYYYLVTDCPFIDCLILFISAIVISFVTSVILYSLKIKRSI